MKPIRVLIIDDEPIAIAVITELIHHLTADLCIVGTARDGMDAVQKIEALKPDLVFIDVDLPYLNGMEVVRKVLHRPVFFFFTTGFASRELKTMQQENTGYLLKPIDPADFLSAVEKVRSSITGDRL